MHVNLSVKMDKLLLNEKFRTDGVRLSVELRSFISYNINILYIKHSSFPRHFLRISKFSPRLKGIITLFTKYREFANTEVYIRRTGYTSLFGILQCSAYVQEQVVSSVS